MSGEWDREALEYLYYKGIRGLNKEEKNGAGRGT